MQEKTFLKIAILTSVIGILLLLFIVENSKIEISNISDITKSSIDSQVRIQGFISSIRSTSSSTILTVNDVTSSIKVIIFAKNLDLSKNDYVEITGKIQEYENNLEILTSNIKKI